MLVDGELPTKDASRAREHLETCWTCRGDLEKVETRSRSSLSSETRSDSFESVAAEKMGQIQR
ncbi:MAG: hypothetical protein IPG58_15550 [Acidobacteria bacterium]|nr:hypothetical protein [Acidobacteriota bacterium]